MATAGFRGSPSESISFNYFEALLIFRFQVKPFLKKLGESGGLQELVLKGVKHVPTQEQFRAGLVKEGGTFRVVNQ